MLKFISTLAFVLLAPVAAASQDAESIAAAIAVAVEQHQEADAAKSLNNKSLERLLHAARENGDIDPLIDHFIQLDAVPNSDEELLSAIETVLLAHTKPLPASNAEANMRGYVALSNLRPNNSTYTRKAQSYLDAFDRKRSAIIRKLKKKRNEFDEITWYEHPNTPRFTDTRNYLELYMAEKNDRAWLRWRLNYTSNSWLFIKSATAKIDGQIVQLPLHEWMRDNDSEIWEWADVLLSDELRSIAIRIAESKETIIRFDGQKYYDDWKVSSSDKKAILDMLLAEQVLNDKLAGG